MRMGRGGDLAQMNILAALFPNSYAKESTEKNFRTYTVLYSAERTFQPRRFFFQVLHPCFLFSGKCRSSFPSAAR